MDPGDTFPAVVARRAALTPSREFVIEVGREPLTFRDLRDQGVARVAGLRRAGVEPGERVVVVSPPCVDAFALWLGLTWLGATPVFVHPALRGAPLERVLRTSGATLAVTWGENVGPLREVADDLRVLDIAELAAPSTDPVAEPDGRGAHVVPDLVEPGPADTAVILFTSGTTGFPKAVPVSWAQLHSTATGHIPVQHLGEDDTWFSPFHLSHVSGLFPVYLMAFVGGRVVIRDRFRTQSFWSDVRTHDCTVTLMFGATATFLLEEPRRADDAVNPLRAVVGFFPRSQDFLERFDIGLHYRAYNQTEVSVPIAITDPAAVPDDRTCGRVRVGFEVRVVDDSGRAVAPGGVGELVVRSEDPLRLASGYLGEPTASAELWRDGWLHTGDLVRQDENGWFYFVDRVTDSIRRRGENISSMEVEAEALTHQDIAEAAVIGVPAADGDQELRLVLTTRPGRTVGVAEIRSLLEERLPAFMVPRYIDIVSDLPRTDTGKIRKRELSALFRDGSVTR